MRRAPPIFRGFGEEANRTLERRDVFHARLERGDDRRAAPLFGVRGDVALARGGVLERKRRIRVETRVRVCVCVCFGAETERRFRIRERRRERRRI